ncbi:glycosyltransferase [candidate division KSB3 bacterium]|nr:glycosyltransferase [candidate division KSB3 bacterium]
MNKKLDTKIMISVVTPTLHRPEEVAGLLENLSQQTLLPAEIILVDGAPPEEIATQEVVAALAPTFSFDCRYIRHGGGTAIQRNVGIDAATGEFIAFVDDDIRLEPDFFERMIEVFKQDEDYKVGGITGYITNAFLDPNTSSRWRWYKRLRIFTTYEPGRYDFETGSPINRYLQPPHKELREIDFMGAGCAIWREEVFHNGLRFSPFFKGYGILEDAHLALRAGQDWTLLENGRAHCVHLKSKSGRVDLRQRRKVSTLNHRYVFVDIVPNRTWMQEFRFWRRWIFDLLRVTFHALRHGDKESWMVVLGQIEGIFAAARIH